jgi:hypothetical protein
MSRITTLFVLVPALLVSTQPSRAATLGIYADAEGTLEEIEVAPGLPFDFWAVAHGLTDDIQAYELSVALPSELFATSISTFPDICMCLCVCGQLSPNNFARGTGSRVPAEDPRWLVHYTVMLDAPLPPDGVLVCPGPAVPRSVDPPRPAYVTWEGAIVPFEYANAIAAGGCLLVRSSTVGTDAPTWSTLKASYGPGHP